MARKLTPREELAGIWADYEEFQHMQYPRIERADRLVDRLSDFLIEHSFLPKTGRMHIEAFCGRKYRLCNSLEDYLAVGSPAECAQAAMARVPALNGPLPVFPELPRQPTKRCA